MRNNRTQHTGSRTSRVFSALTAALTTLILMSGCAGPAIKHAFTPTPKRPEPRPVPMAKRSEAQAKPTAPQAKRPEPQTSQAAPAAAAQAPAPVPAPPPIKRPDVIGDNAMRHFKNAIKAAETSPGEAIKGFNMALASEPYFTEARYGLAITIFKLGDAESAKTELKKAADTDFATATVYTALGVICAQDKEYPLATEFLVTAAEADPANPRRLANLAAVYSLSGNQALADKTYAEALKLSPDDPYVNYNLGIKHLAMKEYGKAVEELKKSLPLQDNFPETALAYAASLFETGNYSEAKAAYTEAARLHPWLAAPSMNLGIIYEIVENDYKKAAESYEKYISLGGERAKEVKQWLELLKEKDASAKGCCLAP